MIVFFIRSKELKNVLHIALIYDIYWSKTGNSYQIYTMITIKYDIQFDLGGVICRGTYMSSFSSSTRRLASSVEEVSPLSMAESLETDRELLKDNNRINSLITLSQMKYRNRLMNIKSKNGKSICIFVQDSIIFKFPSV